MVFHYSFQRECRQLCHSSHGRSGFNFDWSVSQETMGPTHGTILAFGGDQEHRFVCFPSCHDPNAQ